MGYRVPQGQAEGFLEALHSQVEKELRAYLEDNKDRTTWPDFRQNLIGLTDVTRSHFDKLVSVGPLHTRVIGSLGTHSNQFSSLPLSH